MMELINWILVEGRDGDDLGRLLQGLCERLVALGIPLCRANLFMPTIDPTASVLSFSWSHQQGLTSAALTPDDTRVPFQRSPINDLMTRRSVAGRWNLQDPGVAQKFVL